MEFRTTSLNGVLEIIPAVFSDDRGYFKETFASSRYREAGIEKAFVQDNVSVSRRGTVRGLHGDPRMAKLVQVLRGRAIDIVVDLRKGSPSFLRWIAIELTATNHRQVYIPEGCLHGFLARDDETLLAYKQTAEYDPRTEFAVAWNDPDLAIEWPLEGVQPLLSPKDAANPTLRQLGYL